MGDSDQTAGTTFSLVRYNNPVVIDKEETIVRPKSAPASTGEPKPQFIHMIIPTTTEFIKLTNILVKNTRFKVFHCTCQELETV